MAKLHKIEERKGSVRADDKDALDVFRLLRGVSTEELAARIKRVRSDTRSAEAGARGLALLRELFGRGCEGAEMGVCALVGVMGAAEVRLACELLAADLFSALALGAAWWRH